MGAMHFKSRIDMGDRAFKDNMGTCDSRIHGYPAPGPTKDRDGCTLGSQG